MTSRPAYDITPEFSKERHLSFLLPSARAAGNAFDHVCVSVLVMRSATSVCACVSIVDKCKKIAVYTNVNSDM